MEVNPKFWGCPKHWFSLPVRLRELIWKHYRRGQEVTKRPSPEYIDAAQQVQAWIIEQTKMHQARAKKFPYGHGPKLSESDFEELRIASAAKKKRALSEPRSSEQPQGRPRVKKLKA